MKVRAFASFDLALELPLEHIIVLQKLALVHYDGTCKSAGGTTGFITMWRRNIEAYAMMNERDKDEEGFTPFSLDIHAKSRDIDICLKIMEQMYFCHSCRIIDDEELRNAIEVKLLFMRLFRKLQELYSNSKAEWDESLGENVI